MIGKGKEDSLIDSERRGGRIEVVLILPPLSGLKLLVSRLGSNNGRLEGGVILLRNLAGSRCNNSLSCEGLYKLRCYTFGTATDIA